MLSRRKRAEARVEVQQLSPILMITQVSHMETALEWWDPSVRVHNVTLLTKASKLDYPKKKKKKKRQISYNFFFSPFVPVSSMNKIFDN